MLSGERSDSTSDLLVLEHGPFKVYELELSPEKIWWLWQNMSACRTLFSDITRDNFDNFTALVMGEDSVWLDVRKNDKPIGVIYFTDLHLVTECYAHIVFFDRNLAEKPTLCKAVAKWAFTKFHIHRLSACMPEIYFATICLAKRTGFKKEGVRQQVYMIGGKWVNEVMLGMTREDINGWLD